LAYQRDDGLWDLEARLVDSKPRDIALASGIRPQGVPVHDMTLCVTIDTALTILEATSRSDSTPYPGECERINSAYAQLVGLNLMRGFRHAVRERLGGIAGCTHLTELTAVLPTVAIQAFAGVVVETGDGAPASEAEADDPSKIQAKPFQIDRCHALRSDGTAVRQYYPRWYRTPADLAEPDTSKKTSRSEESA